MCLWSYTDQLTSIYGDPKSLSTLSFIPFLYKCMSAFLYVIFPIEMKQCYGGDVDALAMKRNSSRCGVYMCNECINACRPGTRLNRKTLLSRYGIPMLKIRRSWHSLIFNMGIPIMVRHLYIETAADDFAGSKFTTWLVKQRSSPLMPFVMKTMTWK